MCADLELDDISALFKSKKAQMAYSDPPWNKGNAKSFQTKNGTPRDVDFPSFIKKVVSTLQKYTERDIAIEMGNKEAPNVKNIIKNLGGIIIQDSEIFYGDNKPNRLIRFHFSGSVYDREINIPSEYRDEKIVKSVLEKTMLKKGEIVFDCCAGLGMTARVAYSLGLVFYGVELNPRRLANVLEFFSKKGLHPRRVEEDSRANE